MTIRLTILPLDVFFFGLVGRLLIWWRWARRWWRPLAWLSGGAMLSIWFKESSISFNNCCSGSILARPVTSGWRLAVDSVDLDCWSLSRRRNSARSKRSGAFINRRGADVDEALWLRTEPSLVASKVARRWRTTKPSIELAFLTISYFILTNQAGFS